MSRYQVLKQQEILNKTLNEPVEALKYAITKDIKRNIILVQVKLLKLTEKELNEVKLKLLYKENESDSSFIETYHVLNATAIEKGTTFGDKNPIVLESYPKEVKVTIEKVAFINEKDWESEIKDEVVIELNDYHKYIPNELKDQFEIERNLLLDNTELIYRPYREKKYWVCTCGKANTNEVEKCVRCNSELTTLMNIFDLTYLEEQKREREELEDEEKQKLLIKETERIKKQKKLEKRARRIAAILVLFAILGTAGYYGITSMLWQNRYAGAIESYETGNFIEAHQKFEELGDYKDAESYLERTVVGRDFQIMDNIYSMLESEDHGAAIEELDKHRVSRIKSNIKDEEQHKDSMSYVEALISKNEGDLETAMIRFEALSKNDFLDAGKQYQKLAYELAEEAFNKKEWETAIENLFKLDEQDYPQVTEMIATIEEEVGDLEWYSLYTKTVKLIDNGSFTTAYELLTEFNPNAGYFRAGYDINNLEKYKDLHKYYIVAAARYYTLNRDPNIGYEKYSQLYDLYYSIEEIIGFEGMAPYILTDQIWTVVRLDGVWESSDGFDYFELDISDDGLEVISNLGWQDGDTFRFLEDGEIMQIRANGEYHNTYRFSLNFQGDTLTVTSYYDGRTYTLHKK